MSNERWRSPIENMAERLEDLAEYLDECGAAQGAIAGYASSGDILRRAAYLLALHSEVTTVEERSAWDLYLAGVLRHGAAVAGQLADVGLAERRKRFPRRDGQ